MHAHSALATPARQSLSTDGVPTRQRLDYWMETVGSLYCQLECEPPDEDPIFGDIQFSRIGELHFTRLQSNGRRVWRTPARISASNDDHCLVIIQRQGNAVVRQDGREATVRPGDFVFNDCTRPYELLFDASGHELFVLRLARAQLENHVGNLEELTAMAVRSEGAPGQLLLSMVDTLQRDIDQLHPSSAIAVSEGIASIIAAGLRSLPGANIRKPSNLTAYHLARIKAHVQKHLRDPALSIGSIVAAVGLSPDHVCRLFRNEPLSLSRMIWQQRVDACRRELVDPRSASRSISDIAFSWGFNDAAHFSHSFRKQVGLSPREWRVQAQERATL